MARGPLITGCRCIFTQVGNNSKQLIRILFTTGALALALASCKSDFDCNGKLKGTHPLILRKCILGTWTMTGSGGGFSGQGLGDVSDRQIKFTITDSIYYFVKGQKVAGDKIAWVYELDRVREQNYIMQFHDVYGGSWAWGVDGIYSGQLVISENVVDGFTYYLTKQL